MYELIQCKIFDFFCFCFSLPKLKTKSTTDTKEEEKFLKHRSFQTYDCIQGSEKTQMNSISRKY